MSENNKKEIIIPKELPVIVKNFIAAVLISQPDNIIDFAVEYFRYLVRQHNDCENNFNLSSTNISESTISINTREFFPYEPKRRISIIPEYYNPEEDSNFEKQRKIFSKTIEEKNILLKSLEKSYLFDSRNSAELSVLLDALEPLEVKANTTIITEGADGDCFYVIEKGTFKATKRNIHLKTYKDAGCFGELALIYNQPRSATVTALTDGKLWFIDRNTFRRCILHVAYNTSKTYMEFLNSIDLFQNLSESEKYSLIDTFRTIVFEDGEIIFNQGEVQNHMYFVVEGFVDIQLKQNGIIKKIKTCKKGDYFGELALLTKKPRTASAVSVGQTVVAALDVQAFENTLGKSLDILKMNAENYSAVLQNLFGTRSFDELYLR